jgi:hypothetical protein
MPKLSSVLQKLSERIRANGAQVAYRPLEMLSSTTSFLEAVGVKIEDEISAAALAVSLLGPDDARLFGAELNLPTQLFPETAKSAFGSDLVLVKMLRGDLSHAIVGAAALYSRHYFATQQADTAKLKSLSAIYGLLESENGPHPGIVQTLRREVEKLDGSASPAHKDNKDHYLFSISIDMVGSTDAKARVQTLSTDQNRIDCLNLNIYSQFCMVEDSFYKAAINRYVNSLPIPLDKFFVVKGIGDEIWILCNVTPDEVVSVGKRLIDAAIHVSAQSVRFLAMENVEGPHFSPDFEPGRIEPITSPIKVYLDLIKNATNAGEYRENFLGREVPKLLKNNQNSPPIRSDVVSVMRRLGLASFEPIGAATARSYRTDYIGHEIDRFFRATKMVLPGVVTIGETLATAMKLDIRPIDGAISAVYLDDRPLRAGTPSDPIHCCRSTSETWKGIGYAYSTHTLFAPRTLKKLFVQMDADHANKIPALPYTETAEIIPRSRLYKLVENIVADRGANN